MSNSDAWIKYELWQRGICVASVSGVDRQRCFAEIMHYATQYAEDGECVVKGPMPDDVFEEEEE